MEDNTEKVGVWKLKKAFNNMEEVAGLIPIKKKIIEKGIVNFYSCIFECWGKLYRVYTNDSFGGLFEDLTHYKEPNAIAEEVEVEYISFTRYKKVKNLKYKDPHTEKGNNDE